MKIDYAFKSINENIILKSLIILKQIKVNKYLN